MCARAAKREPHEPSTARVGPGLCPGPRTNMQPKYDYRRRLPHLQKDSRPIFVTFITFHRWILPPQAREIVLDCCLKENGVKVDLHAAVMMTDHAHLLLTPLRRSDGWLYPLYDIMRAIKGTSARRINALLARRGKVWQEESFDHVLRSNDRLAEKMDYICQNPVRAGLATSKTTIGGFGEELFP